MGKPQVAWIAVLLALLLVASVAIAKKNKDVMSLGDIAATGPIGLIALGTVCDLIGCIKYLPPELVAKAEADKLDVIYIGTPEEIAKCRGTKSAPQAFTDAEGDIYFTSKVLTHTNTYFAKAVVFEEIMHHLQRRPRKPEFNANLGQGWNEVEKFLYGAEQMCNECAANLATLANIAQLPNNTASTDEVTDGIAYSCVRGAFKKYFDDNMLKFCKELQSADGIGGMTAAQTARAIRLKIYKWILKLQRTQV